MRVAPIALCSAIIFGLVVTACGAIESTSKADLICNGDYEMKKPGMLQIDSRGRLIIAEFRPSKVVRFDVETMCFEVLIPSGYNEIYGMELSDDEEFLYFTNLDEDRIQSYEFATGQIETVAGNGEEGFDGDGGPALEAKLWNPYDIVLDGRGGLIIADTDNDRFRRVDLETGYIITIAGTGERGFAGDGGPAIDATFRRPHVVALDETGSIIIGDSFNHLVRRINADTGVINTIAGNTGPAIAGQGEIKSSGDGKPPLEASFMYFGDIILEKDGSLLIAEYHGEKIRRISKTTGLMEHVAGLGPRGSSGDGGPAILAYLNGPTGLVKNASGDIIFTDYRNASLRKIDSETGVITTLYTGVE